MCYSQLIALQWLPTALGIKCRVLAILSRLRVA